MNTANFNGKRGALKWLCSAGLAAALPTAQAQTAVQLNTLPGGASYAPLPPLVMGQQIGAGWRVLTLPQQKPPVTRFTPETVGGKNALRIESVGSYGNLVHEPVASIPRSAPLGSASGTKPAAVPGRLNWAWQMQVPNPGVDISSKTGDDLPAKVCLSFDLPLGQVPFFERELLRIARSRTGENLSAATLCWVWGGAEAHEHTQANPYTRRVRYIVVRNNTDALNTWAEESRDIAADFQRAFGDESTTMPPISAVLVGGDADNTGARSVAFVTGLRWAP